MINSEIIRIASDTTNNGIKKESNLIATLKNKTCGVFGVGGIGQLVAEKLHSFGMKIIGFENKLIKN